MNKLGLILITYFCSLFQQLKRTTWNIKNLLAIVLKSRILLKCPIVSELNDNFLLWRKISKSAFFHRFLTDNREDQTRKPRELFIWNLRHPSHVFPHCHLAECCHPSSFSPPILIEIRKKMEKRINSFCSPKVRSWLISKPPVPALWSSCLGNNFHKNSFAGRNSCWFSNRKRL